MFEVKEKKRKEKKAVLLAQKEENRRSNLGIAKQMPNAIFLEKQKHRLSQDSNGGCKQQGALVSACGFSIPCNLFILTLPGLDLQTPFVHVVYVASTLKVTEDVILELPDRLQKVRYVLVLLNITNDFCGLGPLIEVDQF